MAGGFQFPNFFGGSNRGNQPTPPVSGGQPGSARDQLSPQNDPTKLNGNTGAADNKGGSDADPTKGAQGSQLENFKSLWENPVDDKGQPIQQPEDPLNAGPIVNLDPAKLKDTISKANFATGLTQEQIQQAMQSPENLVRLVNTMQQNAFQAAMTTASGMMNEALNRHTQRIESALPTRIRNEQVAQASLQHPVLSHPAVAPLVDGVKHVIAQKNPHLTPEKVMELTASYFKAMQDDMAAGVADASKGTNKGTPQSPDWESLLLTPNQ